MLRASWPMKTYITGGRDQLPTGFKDGKTVFFVHITVYREHLPGKKIEERKMPCAIVWDQAGTLVCTWPSGNGRKWLPDDTGDED
jgi:hypothetical protein